MELYLVDLPVFFDLIGEANRDEIKTNILVVSYPNMKKYDQKKLMRSLDKKSYPTHTKPDIAGLQALKRNLTNSQNSKMNVK